MLRIESVKPTVLFKNADSGLVQVVEVAVKNTAKTPTDGATLTFTFPGSEPVVCPLPAVEPKASTVQVDVPDIREACPVAIELAAPRCKAFSMTHDWQPRKHWEIHLIPIAHHDYGYTDPVEDILYFYEDLYARVADYCEATADYPEEARFHYTCEGSWSLRHFLNVADDATIDKLAKYVAEGRVEIPALLGNQTSGMCSHEELVRLAYPSRQIQDRLGGEVCVGSITDIPGLSWTLPTILNGVGVKYFFAGLPHYFTDPSSHTSWDESRIVRETGVSDAFWWEGPDGSKVLVSYEGGYGGFGSPESVDDVMKTLPPRLDQMDAKGNPFSVFRAPAYGCGDNTPTSTIGCELAKEWNATYAFPKIRMSTNTKFFKALEPQCEDLRTFRGELPHTDYAVGAVSTAKETSLNRVTHDYLPAIERFATIASVDNADLLTPGSGHFHNTRIMPLDIPAMGQSRRIDDAWYDMMMFDEHTWGMWCPVGSIQDFNWHDKARHAYRAASTTTIMGRRALNSIAQGVAREEGTHVVVFNSLTTERSDVVRVTGLETDNMWMVNADKLPSKLFELVDMTTGKSVPYQIIELDSPQSPHPHTAGRYSMGTSQDNLKHEMVFLAEDVPPVGYKAFRIVKTDAAPSFDSPVSVTDTTVENEFFKVSVDAKTGLIESIFDKQLSRELTDADADHAANQLVVKHGKTAKIKTGTKGKIRIGQAGPIMASLIVTSQAPGCPQITQEIALFAGVKRVDFNNRVLKDSTPILELYFAFPLKVDSPQFAFEGPGSVMKPFENQFPGSNTNYYSVQHWADVSDGEMGITLTPIDSHLVEFGGIHPFHVSPAHRNIEPKDFKQGYVDQEAVTASHIYSFVLASNFCTNFQPSQQGDLLFRYSLTTHDGDWQTGQPRDFGWGRANPLLASVLNDHSEGTRGPSDSFCQVDQTNIVLTSLKRADNEDGLIVRLMETEGRETEATVSLPFANIASANLTDLVERDGESVAVNGSNVTVTVPAFGITTFRVKSE
jgi:alpha-mannosidase